MVEVTPTAKGASLKVANGYAPNDGPRTVPIAFDFSAAATYNLDLTLERDTNRVEFIQTVFIDNWIGTSDLSVFVFGTNQTIICPSGSMGYFPILSTNEPKFTIACADGRATIRWLQFLTMPVAASIWKPCCAAPETVVVRGLLGNNVDSVADVTTGNLGVDGYNYLHDNSTNTWSRQVSLKEAISLGVGDGKGVAVTSIIGRNTSANPSVPPTIDSPSFDASPVSFPTLFTASYAFGFNGVSFDRLETTTGLGTTTANPAVGLLGVGIYVNDGTTYKTVKAPSQLGDGNSLAFSLSTANYVYNGSGWDRQRNNFDTAALQTLAAAAAGTSTSADQTNYNGRGVNVVVDLTTVTTATVTVTVQGKDAASGKYYTLLTSTALATAGTTLLSVYPGNAVNANLDASLPLPRIWRVSTTIVGASAAVTGTIGASVIV